jgi:enamine deaminase RidA (YjgF/YER057c/UK114 family)
MIEKQQATLGTPWEAGANYSQGVKVGDTIYLAGQISHDDDANIVGAGDMELQMRTAFRNVERVLAQYGANMDNVVDELILVTDMDAAIEVLMKIGSEVHSGVPPANTLVQISRLAFPELMVEIKCIAKV